MQNTFDVKENNQKAFEVNLKPQVLDIINIFKETIAKQGSFLLAQNCMHTHYTVVYSFRIKAFSLCLCVRNIQGTKCVHKKLDFNFESSHDNQSLQHMS